MNDTQTQPCTCAVHHALTYAERGGVVTALEVARAHGDTDRVAYLGQQLERCPSSCRPVVVQRPRVKPIRRSAWRFGGAR